MDVKAEKIKPYLSDGRDKGQQVRTMFDNIAPAYDFMNRAMTLGIDRSWRKKAVKMVAACSPGSILDVATGTGDLALALARALPQARVEGVDLSDGMLQIARKKIEDAALSDRVNFSRADCLCLPMDSDTFDCVTVAYGVRNFQDLLGGYREMLRVLRPGGMLCVVELSSPQSAVVKPLYKIYTRGVIPLVGRIVSADNRAYSYLPESIAAVPQGSDMTTLIAEAGFHDAAFRPLTFGVCTIYTAYK